MVIWTILNSEFCVAVEPIRTKPFCRENLQPRNKIEKLIDKNQWSKCLSEESETCKISVKDYTSGHKGNSFEIYLFKNSLMINGMNVELDCLMSQTLGAIDWAGLLKGFSKKG